MTEKTSHKTFEFASFKYPEMVQFNDGGIVLGFRTPGDVIDWDFHKYSRNLDTRSRNAAIVSMDNGDQYAFGNGVAIKLPQLGNGGRYGQPGEKVTATTIDRLAPSGLTPAILGEAWDVIGGDAKVREVLLDYKVGPPNSSIADEQVDMPNPFVSVHEHLDRVSNEIYDFGE